MAAFRMRKDARKWFKPIRNDKAFKIDFDSFYFCAMAGLATNQQHSVKHEETVELVEAFPRDYKETGRLLVALFLNSKLKSLGISLENRDRVHKAIRDYIEPNSQNHMTNEGVQEFCRYAHGGFDVLANEWFADRPRSLETFLVQYRVEISKALESQDMS